MTYDSLHGKGCWQRSEYHHPPVVPTSGVITKIDNPGGDANLARCNLLDVRPFPGRVTRSLVYLIGTGDIEVTEVAVVVV